MGHIFSRIAREGTSSVLAVQRAASLARSARVPTHIMSSNFVAKFDVDSDVALLSLESKDYDPTPDGAYEAWMILEPTDEGTAEAGEADGAGDAVQ